MKIVKSSFPLFAKGDQEKDEFADEERIFNLLYHDCTYLNAKAASRQERLDNSYQSLSFVYGDIAVIPFLQVLHHIFSNTSLLESPGKTFLDIGSGTGKAVFTAALNSAYTFQHCYGIEYISSLHEFALERLQRWESLKESDSSTNGNVDISFQLGDALSTSWPRSDSLGLIFMNSTCFSASLRRRLAEKIENYCQTGTLVLTATHKLTDTHSYAFDIVETMQVEQDSWGKATWYLHRCTTNQCSTN